MSGLFRRLAQHASGRATTLHAPSRLPFQHAPAATGALDIASTEMNTEAPSPIVAVSAQPRPNPPHVFTNPEPIENVPATTDAAPSASALPAMRAAAKAASAFDSLGEAIRHDSTEQAANPARADQPAHRARMSVGALDVPSPIVPRNAAKEPLPRPLEIADSVAGTADPLTPTRTIDGAAPPEFPPTLLPPQLPNRPDAATVATNARPQMAEHSENRARSATADAPNEVHVHIGRIEVTAIQDSAPKPRAKRNGHAPMSLDEYVAKRRQGSS